MSNRSFGWLFVKVSILWAGLQCVNCGGDVLLSSTISGIGIKQVQPARVTQFVRTTVTVALNASLCTIVGQDALSDAQLVFPHAAADGSDLAFRSGASTQNSCISLQFRVMLGKEAKAGVYVAYVLLPGLQSGLLLPMPLAVVTMPLLSMKARYMDVAADQTAFAVGVDLSYPAGEAGASVKLQVLDSGAAKIYGNTLTWAKGASGTQSFWVSLQYIPSNGRLTLQLAQPQGAVMDPAASSTSVMVLSPMVGFASGLGYYRGLNSSIPLLNLTVTGTSAFPSQFNYTTFPLPGSRPSVPCHPLASTCSMADVEAVNSVTVSGTRWLQPGQQEIEPIQLPVNWNRLPPETELRIGVKITGISNVRVAWQLGQVAAIIFGTPPGRCPPGSSLLSDSSSNSSIRGSDWPPYTNVAALQELAFSLFPTNGSISNRSPRAVFASREAASSSESGSTLDLDPPFSPMVDKYVGLLPPKPKGGAQLLLASSRWGDAVVVDATACLRLNSSRYQVQWVKPQRMWRQRYSLAGQKSPCWLRVHVFTKTAAQWYSAPTYGSSSTSSTSSSSTGVSAYLGYGSSGNTTSSTWALPDDFVLYRTYTIRFVPLKSPEQLSLRSITYSNDATTVIACGVPRSLSHLFQTTPPPSLSAVMGMDGNSSSKDSNGSTDSSSGANSLLDLAPAGHVSLSRGSAAAGSGNAGAVTADPTAAGGASSPLQRLVPAAGQTVQVAYLVVTKPAAIDDLTSNSTSSAQESQQQQRRQQQQQADAALDGDQQGAQEQYSLFDPISNKTIVWNQFTSAVCPQDRYVMLSLAQVKSDMKMVPELVEPDPGDVDIKMTQAALALASSTTSKAVDMQDTEVASSDNRSASGNSSGQSTSPVGPAVKAGVLGGWNRLNAWSGLCSGSGSSVSKDATAASSILSSSKGARSSSSSSKGPCGLRLPGITAEVPIIITADEGRSSKTYTLLLYSNASAAAAAQNMVLPQEAAAAAADVSTAAAAEDSSRNATADAARLSAAYFAGRPQDWPQSPAQSDRCAVCPNGTYSTRVDAYDCKVCPPGKYAASPFSTSCLFCPPGTFSYYWGAPSCRKCLPGTSALRVGSLFCDICRDGTTTYSEGSTSCDITVTSGSTALDALSNTSDSEYAYLLTFGVVLDGALLEAVSRSTTGINGSSEGIVAVLVRSDTATALNVSLGSVQVKGVQQLDSRQLLINVSAAVPADEQAEQDGVTAEAQDLAADELIQRLIDDPNTFLRTTQTLGAEGVTIQDLTTLKTRRSRWGHNKLHAILWPSLFGSFVVLGLLWYFLWRWRRRRRVQRLTQQLTGGLEFAAAAAATGISGFLRRVHTDRGTGLRSRGPITSSGGISPGALGEAYDSSPARSNARSIAWRRNWQRFWSSNVHVVVDSSGSPSSLNLGSPAASVAGVGVASAGGAGASSSGARPAAKPSMGSPTATPVGCPVVSPTKFSLGRSSSAGSCGSCSPASSHMGSGCSDGMSVTLDMGDIRASGAGGGDFCYNEESFQARLRAKQLGAAGTGTHTYPGHW